MCSPPLVSEGRGPHLGAQQAFWAQVGRANALVSSPAPPTCLSCSPLGLPPMPPGPMLLRVGGSWRAGDRPGSSAGSQAEWAGQSPSAPLLLLLEGPSRLPLLISLASVMPILSGLHFSSPLSTPTSYRFTWGFLLSSWVSGSPPVAGRRPSCGATLT